MRLFGTDGLRGRVNEWPLTADMALRLGLAAGAIFRDGERRHKVIIGKDTRLSGYMLESALTSGLCAAGMDVYQVGPLPTPAIAFLTRNMRADLGIVISASHNPYYDNGIKFFDRDGYKLPDQIEDRISELLLDQNQVWAYPASNKVGRAARVVDAPGRYIVYIKNSFPNHLTLEGLRVVIDCANGANYKIAPLALEELGAEVFRLGTTPDGLNINQGCGSLYPQAMQEKVLEVRADVGLALDGDADRVIMCDEKGRLLDGDQLMALCALEMLEHDELDHKLLVGTVMSNLALEVFMRDHGGALLRTPVGDRYVAEAMRAHGAALGGEQSGHLIFSRYGTTGDGLLAGLQILRVMREKDRLLSSLAGLLTPYPQVLLNVPVAHKTPLEENPAIGQAIARAEAAMGTQGRVLLRYSGTENLCRVMVEGENADLVEKQAAVLADVVKQALA